MRFNLLIPILRIFSKRYYKAVAIARKNEKLSKEELLRVQNQKLKKLIRFSKANVPYYKELLNGVDVNDVDDLKKVPFLNKKLIQENFKNIQAQNIDKNRFKKDSTSGSTGETLRFFTDKKLNFVRHACAHRGDSWTGWWLGEPAVYLWASSKDTNKAKTIYKRIINSSLFFNSTILSAYRMKDESMKDYVATINNKKPSLIVGYPSSLYMFAEFIKLNHLNIYSPKGIITGGETLHETQRKQIEDVFQAKILNRYGSREVGHIANECEMQHGLHISSDHVVAEVINEKGVPCKPGELGELVITDLDNYVFPLIRYKIGDLGILSDRTCTCGRPFPMLESVEGRTFDLVIGANGNRILATYFTLYFRHNINGIKKFQIIQKSITEINLTLMVDNNYTQEEESKIIHAIKDKLGEETNVHIKVADFIEPTISGKHRWIISEVSPFDR